MTVRSGITKDTPDRIMIDAGAVYLNYGLANERLLGATRGGNEFNLNRTVKNIEIDGLKGAVKGLKRIVEVNPQITCNLLELTVANLVAAIAGADQSDQADIKNEYVGVGDDSEVRFALEQDDIVSGTEKIYLTDANGVATLKTASNSYNSRFVGDNAVDNKGFAEGTGDWAKGHTDDAIAIATGGQSGNCLEYTGSASSEVGFLTLDADNGAVLTDLVVGQHYMLQIAVKKTGTWGGGAVTVACDAGSEALTLTESWVVYVIEFIATGTSASITLTAASAPTAPDGMYIDSLELKRVDGDYFLDTIGGNIIFPEDDVPTTDEKILASYTYKATDTNQTTITGGEIATSDYIDNVAIVGNVSNKDYPIVCMVKNALADAGFSLSTAPRDEAVPSIVFTGHFSGTDLDTEPWEIRYPNS